MLVITRKVGEKITVETPSGEKIDIWTVQIKGKQTRIGIKARKDCHIFRGEFQKEDGAFLNRDQKDQIEERRKELQDRERAFQQDKRDARFNR